MNKIIILFLALALAGLSLKAQESNAYKTVEECRTQALTYNKELQKANTQIQEAELNRKTARTAYLPKIEASATMMHLPNIADISLPGGFLPTANSAADAQNGVFSGESNVWSPGMNLEMGDMTYVNGSVDLSMALYAGGKIRTVNQQAKVAESIYIHAFDLKYTEVIEKTDRMYWNMASISANVKLAEKYIEMLTELEAQMVNMYKLGLVPISEKLKVSVQKNNAELSLLQAKNGLKISKMYMNQLMGSPLNDAFEISDSLNYEFNMINLVDGLDEALNNRSELKILEDKVKLSNLNHKMVRADYLPQVGVSVSYATLYLNRYAEDLTFDPRISGQISIPIFAWGEGVHKQKVARLQIEQAELELSRTNDLVSLEVEQMRVKISENYESIIIAKKNISEAEESLDETKASFDVGLNTITELLNAQADWQKANVQLITALAEFEILQTSWQKVTGNLQPADQ